MNKEFSADVAIVGGGIIGLAHAYMALKRGLKVVLFEREQFAVGASVRNFGLIWPIGQVPGIGLERALRSREHWLEVTSQAGLWTNQNGSLHAVYHTDEWDVLEEFMEIYKGSAYQCELLNPNAVKSKSKTIKLSNLKGGLWSSSECTINPREAVRRIPLWLQEKFGLMLRFGNVVTEITMPTLKTSRETWRVDHVYVCSGADFETLFPEIYDQQPITKCKLQMMKAVTDIPHFTLGPSLCAGLTLRHYAAFSKCPSLSKVNQRYDMESPIFKKYGIHILLSQNNYGELIIGDSHEYGKTIEPFDQESINDAILQYLQSFTDLGALKITERWHGVYPKMKDSIDMVVEPSPGVSIINGLGGAGMTLSFGLAEEMVGRL